MKFEIVKSGKQWRYRIVAGNGKILSHSERYTRKSGAMNAIRLIQEEAAGAEIMERDDV